MRPAVPPSPAIWPQALGFALPRRSRAPAFSSRQCRPRHPLRARPSGRGSSGSIATMVDRSDHGDVSRQVSAPARRPADSTLATNEPPRSGLRFGHGPTRWPITFRAWRPN